MQIAARQSFLTGRAGPSTPTARDYVQDGLVAMWDGIENAGWGVHDANATVWTNLAQDRWHLPCTTAISWQPDHAHGNGSKPYMAGLVGADNAIPLADSRTVEVVAAYTLNNSYPLYGVAFFFTIAESDTSGRHMISDTSGSEKRLFAYCKNNGGQNKYYVNTSADGELLCLQATYPVTSYGPDTFRVNGVAAASTITSENRSTSNGTIIGGSTRTGVIPGKLFGDIYCVRVYSRALTAAEFAANYAIDAQRFGVTV